MDLQKPVDFFKNSVKMIQSGQVSIGLVESIMVNVDGRQTPVAHLGYAQVCQNGIVINVYDQSHTSIIAKTIEGAGFGSYVYSKTSVMVSRPMPTVEEKQKTIKHINTLAEEARIAVRTVRQNYRNSLSKTDLKAEEGTIQVLVNNAIRAINEACDNKVNSL